jgi:hypothetical protein
VRRGDGRPAYAFLLIPLRKVKHRKRLRVAATAPSGANDWFDAAVANQYHIDSQAFRSQSAINAGTVNVSNNAGNTNLNVVYDAEKDAAEIIISGSLSLYNRVNLEFSAINAGEVLFAWEYLPAGTWLGNIGAISTHKMFMIGTTSRNDNRVLEQRFHYGGNLPNWRCDTRHYDVAQHSRGYGGCKCQFS